MVLKEVVPLALEGRDGLRAPRVDRIADGWRGHVSNAKLIERHTNAGHDHGPVLRVRDYRLVNLSERARHLDAIDKQVPRAPEAGVLAEPLSVLKPQHERCRGGTGSGELITVEHPHGAEAVILATHVDIGWKRANRDLGPRRATPGQRNILGGSAYPTVEAGQPPLGSRPGRPIDGSVVEVVQRAMGRDVPIATWIFAHPWHLMDSRAAGTSGKPLIVHLVPARGPERPSSLFHDDLHEVGSALPK